MVLFSRSDRSEFWLNGSRPCLTRPVPNGRRRSDFWLVPENFCVFLPNKKAERRRPFGTGLVKHCPQGLFSPFFTFFRAIFFRPFRLFIPPPPSPPHYPSLALRGCAEFRMEAIVFSRDVTAAILVSQNNETAAMLVSQTKPLGVELFSHANAFFCSNKFAYMLVTWVKTLYSPCSIYFKILTWLRGFLVIFLYLVWFSLCSSIFW